jgi:transglutaminase-like putative cysteine protease
MRPVSHNLQDYLEATQVIDWHHPAVRDASSDIVAGRRDEVEKAHVLFEWVRDQIPHSADIQADVVTCTASEVLRHGTGICYAKSHLLAAMLRAQHIPAGLCYQVLRRDPASASMVLHGLNGVYLPSLGRWLRVDARGNTGDIDAQFSLTEERLAFPVDAQLGEYTYEEIFAAPATVVLDVLRGFTTRTAMWPYLPTCLDATLPLGSVAAL